VFAQFDHGLQLDLAVLAEPEVRRGPAAPDFVSLYRSPAPPGPAVTADSTTITGGAFIADGAAVGGFPPADAVSPEQIHEWAFLGWCALADAGKYLRRSLWEADTRLHETRHHIWALWAATTGALYPWHGLSQVLNRDPPAAKSPGRSGGGVAYVPFFPLGGFSPRSPQRSRPWPPGWTRRRCRSPWPGCCSDHRTSC